MYLCHNHAMTWDQISILGLLSVTVVMFIWNRWRYDVVAGIALLAAIYLGIVDVDRAFAGFSHPAVITVACVLVISKALQNSGLVDIFLRVLAGARRNATSQIAANCGIVGCLSAFMNNIGALALMLPVTIRDAKKAKRRASKILMPLSFASLLGGLVTMIGTPPNIIIATIRQENLGQPFGMFDFAPVGLAVAVCGLLYIVTIGWRLIPVNGQEEAQDDRFQIARYLTEVRVTEGSLLINSTVGGLEKICENEVTVMAIIRHKRNRLAPSTAEKILEHDVLILQGDSESLQPLFASPGLVQVGDGDDDADKDAASDLLQSEEFKVVEVVIMPNSMMEGVMMRDLRLHDRYGINLLAVSRQGSTPMFRLARIRFRIGDVLLLQGADKTMEQTVSALGCMVLFSKARAFAIRTKSYVTPGVFALGIAAAAFGLVPVQIAFATTCVALILLKAVKLRDAYRSIEWPIIILLGCLIPIGEALHTTGATELISNGILSVAFDIPLWFLIALLIVVSMLLSDLIHNSPTAVLMAPLALSLAEAMQISPDPLLMAVAIGAASAYLTPIGHQSNTLVMGPGGYNFGDYWRMGLPLDIVIVSVAVPMILWVW